MSLIKNDLKNIKSINALTDADVDNDDDYEKKERLITDD